jgi:prolyl-tRNA synthetase
MFNNAKEFLDSHIFEAKNMDEMIKIGEDNIGFIKAMWCGNPDCEDEIKAATGGYGSRCLADDEEAISDKCVFCGKKAEHKVVWGKSY